MKTDQTLFPNVFDWMYAAHWLQRNGQDYTGMP
jgi:hypothetical protein